MLAGFAGTTLVPTISIIDLLGMVIRAASGNSVQSFEPFSQDNTGMLLVFWVLVFYLYSFWTYRIWREWDGELSKLDYRRQLRREDMTVHSFGEDIRLVISFGDKTELYEPIEPDEVPIEPMPVPENKTTWEERAKQLVAIKRQDYSFGIDNDPVFIDDRDFFWVGEHKNNEKLIFVYPIFEDIPPEGLVAFINAVNDQCIYRNGIIGEVIIISMASQITPHKFDGLEITYTTEEQLLDDLVDWRNYKYEIKKRVNKAKLDEDYPIIETYVSQDVVYTQQRTSSPVPPFVIQNSVGRMNLEEQLTKWLQAQGRVHIALLGEYGMGKSTAALMLTYALLNNENISSRYIPILLELRGKSPTTETPESLLASWAHWYGINSQALTLLLRAGRLLIILEGFDEMDLVGDYERRINHFRTLWQFAYPGVKVLFTGRPNYFETIQELGVALQINYQPGINRPSCIRLDLTGFSLEQIPEALQSYPAEIAQQISYHAEQNPDFYDIVKRPSMANALAQIWQQYGLNQETENLTNAKVMQHFIETTYIRQLNKRKNEWQHQVQQFGESNVKPYMILNRQERHYFMRGIAAYMAHKQLNNQIKSSELNIIIRDLLENIPASSNMDTRLSSKQPPLHVRIENDKYGIETLFSDVRSCGLLVHDDAKDSFWKFSHYSQLEFLYASVIADSFILSQKDEEDFYIDAIWDTFKLKANDLYTKKEFLDYFVDMVKGHFVTTDDTVKSARELLAFLEHARINYRIVIVIYIIISSIVKRYRLPKLPYYMTKPLFVITFGAFLGILVAILVNSNKQVYEPLVALIAVLVTLGTELADSSRRRKKSARNRFSGLQAWQYICQRAGISPETMHKAFGTNLKIVDTSKFDYFPMDKLEG